MFIKYNKSLSLVKEKIRYWGIFFWRDWACNRGGRYQKSRLGPPWFRRHDQTFVDLGKQL
jgi:hypothetical protein